MTNRLPRYLSYKNSGVDWLGLVPDHWVVLPSKFVIHDFISGGTPDSGNETFWTTDNRGIPWVSIGDMTKGFIIRTTEKFITELGLENKHLQILPPGTLLYSMYASIGKVALLDIPAATNQAILGIIPGPNLTRSFLAYWYMSIEDKIRQITNSNTQDNLNANKVKNIPIFLPPIPEQVNITRFLNRETARIDTLISKYKQLIELLQEKRSSLISRVVTSGLNPNILSKESGVEWIRMMPKRSNVKGEVL